MNLPKYSQPRELSFLKKTQNETFYRSRKKPKPGSSQTAHQTQISIHQKNKKSIDENQGIVKSYRIGHNVLAKSN